MIATNACDLCGESQYEPLCNYDRKGQPLRTVVCCNCGLVAHACIPTCEELARYYTEHYRQNYHGNNTPAPYRVVREWKRGQNILARLQSDLAPGAHVLEVGSGIGCTVMNFCMAGFSAKGIEPGEGFAEFSRTRMHADIRRCSLSELPPVAEYDLVLLVHVLEHLPSPTDALTRIARLLRPSGKLYIEVPNFNAPHAAPGKQFHFAHIYNFTPATLRMVAAKTGFKVEHAYTPSRDKVIAFLLTKSPSVSFRLEGMSYSQTVEAAHRFSRLSYYARLGYVFERAVKTLGRATERATAQRSFHRILAQCDAFYEQSRQQPTNSIRRVA